MKDKTFVKTVCPTSETLQQLIDGTVDDVEQLETHLQSCASCRTQLDHLSSSNVLRPFQADGVYHQNNGRYRFLGESQRDGDIGSINHLFIVEEIGRGGAGIVFRGFDPELSRPVAVKVLNNDGFRSEARFERESKIAAKIRSDFIVNVHAVGKTDDGRPYLVMPLISGQTLRDLNVEQILDERRATEIILQIGTGLQTLHDSGIVHRDVKPANILIDEEDQRAKLTDFGLARETAGNITLTQADVLCGTPEYMSPEQSSGRDATSQSDVYSLGITLYECLTGTTPFRGSPVNILNQHCRVEPIGPRQINPGISKSMENICLKAISKDPSRRYQSSFEFTEDLNRFLNGRPVLAREISSLEKLVLWARRNRRVAVLSGLVAGLLLALGVGSSMAAWKLKQANDQIFSEKQKAIDAEQRAVKDRSAAVHALNDLVDSLYDDLSDNSATVKAREKLVSAAMNGLQSVSRIDVESGDDASNKTEFVALRRMGYLAQLKGDTVLAEERMNQAIEVARNSVQLRPDDDRWKLDLANAINDLGTLLQRAGNEQSKELSDEALAIVENLLDRNPDNYDALLTLVTHKNNQLELLRNATNQQTISELGEAILADVARLIEHAENDNPEKSNDIYQASYHTHFIIGRAVLEFNDPGASKSYFETAREHIELALAQTPNNFQLRTAKASLDRALAMAAGALGDMQESQSMFESSQTALSQLIALNPDNVNLKSQLASSLSFGSYPLLVSGEFEQALEVLGEADLIYAELVEMSPDKEFNKIVLAENRFRISQVQLSAGHWEASHQTAIETLEYLENLKSEPYAAYVLNQKVQFNHLMQTTGWLTNRPPESPSLNGKINAVMNVIRPEALTATSLELPPVTLALLKRVEPDFSGTTYGDLFMTVNEMINDNAAFQTQSAIVELGVYSLIAKNCLEIANEEMQTRSEQCLQHCLEMIETKQPTLESLKTNFDLKWLLNQDEVQSVLSDMQEAQQTEQD